MELAAVVGDPAPLEPVGERGVHDAARVACDARRPEIRGHSADVTASTPSRPFRPPARSAPGSPISRGAPDGLGGLRSKVPDRLAWYATTQDGDDMWMNARPDREVLRPPGHREFSAIWANAERTVLDSHRTARVLRDQRLLPPSWAYAQSRGADVDGVVPRAAREGSRRRTAGGGDQVGVRSFSLVRSLCVIFTLMTVVACGSGVPAGPSSGPTQTAPPPRTLAPALPTSSGPPSIAPSDSLAGEWRTVAGFGHWMSYPATWQLGLTPDGSGIGMTAPDSLPDVKVTNLGTTDGVSVEILTAGNLMSIREDGSADATSSGIRVGTDDGMAISFHSTGDTGRHYYRINAYWAHDGTLFSFESFFPAGDEAGADALVTRFLDSITYPAADELAFIEFVCRTPAGWTLALGPSNGMARQGPAGQVFQISPVSGRQTLAAWAEKAIAQAGDLGHGVEVEPAVSGTVAGLPSMRVAASLTAESGSMVLFDEAVFSGEKGYELLWASPPGHESTYEEIVDSCAFMP